MLHEREGHFVTHLDGQPAKSSAGHSVGDRLQQLILVNS